jgi:hypothetical protein
MKVWAFQTPPSRSTSRSSVPAGNWGVPLNIMCSTQWETPVCPVRSLRLPTRYSTRQLTIGAVWIGLSRTVRPFFRTCFWTDAPMQIPLEHS